MTTKLKRKSTAGCSISDILHLKPSTLKPWPGNPRTHPSRQREALRASIEQFGITSALLVDEANTILSGHARREVALMLNLPTVPVRVIAGLTQAQKRALLLGDNKIASMSGWDEDQLRAQLELLFDEQFEVELTGFSTAEIDLMFEEPPLSPSVDPAELQPADVAEESVSVLGDQWELGHHRLLCADARSASSYSELMRGEQAQMVFTDPPFNVPIAGHAGGKGKVKHKDFAMACGEMSSTQFTDFLAEPLRHAHSVMREGAIAYVCMDWRHITELQEAARPVFGPPRQFCVWVKDNGGMGTFYRSQHELVLVFKKGSAQHINNFELGQYGRYRTNVWEYPGVNTFKGKGCQLLALHPTVKPVSLVADALRDCSHRQGLVLDPFAGSGTILIAAERTGRCARAIELDPRYVDTAVLRWQRVTGQPARLVGSGKSWDVVRSERLSQTVGRYAA